MAGPRLIVIVGAPLIGDSPAGDVCHG